MKFSLERVFLALFTIAVLYIGVIVTFIYFKSLESFINYPVPVYVEGSFPMEGSQEVVIEEVTEVVEDVEDVEEVEDESPVASPSAKTDE